MRRACRRILSLLLCCSAILFVVRRARADGEPLDGTWIAGPLTETVTVASWVDECGPRPKPRTLGGGAYTVTIAGDELVFSGAQPFRTDACFEQEDTKRVSHSATPSLRTWKTRCESAPGDPRKASLTTLVRAANDDVIILTETAHYASTLQSGTCAADVERVRTFTRPAKPTASTTASAPPATTSTTTTTTTTTATTTIAAPTVPKTPVCESVGDPSKLEVRPKRKVIRPGESFDFVARVLDDKGCETTTKATFRLAPESSSLATTVLVDANGHVKVRADADPVDAALVVEAGPPLSTSVHVDLEIVSDERYAELLGTGGLDDAGVDDRPVSVVVSNEGGAPSTIVEPKSDESARKRFAWIAIAGGVGMLFVLVVFVATRRRSSAMERSGEGSGERSGEGSGDDRRSPFAREPRGAPTVRGVAPSPPLPAAAASSLVQTQVGTPDSPGEVAAQIRICPRCGERYPSDAGFCPLDGQRLVAVRDVAGRAPVATAEPPSGAGRICPVCGKRYARDASFCGKDGVELVPLN